VGCYPEGEGVPFIRQHVRVGPLCHAPTRPLEHLARQLSDEAVNHSFPEYVAETADVNQARVYFARLRRAIRRVFTIGSKGDRLQAYANEMAWPENHGLAGNGTHWNLIATASLLTAKSAIGPATVIRQILAS